jgi:hypothetical protein
LKFAEEKVMQEGYNMTVEISTDQKRNYEMQRAQQRVTDILERAKLQKI